MTTPIALSREDEKRAAAIVLAAVKHANGDEQLADDKVFRDAVEGIASQGDVVPVLIDLADAVAANFQQVIDAGGSVDDVAALLRASIGTPAEAAPPAA